MTDSKSLTATHNTPTSEWNHMKEQAAILLKTGFLPKHIQTVEQALAIAMTGKELKIPMMEALRGINVIQGKPSVSPQLMMALARRTGEVEYFSIRSTATGATVKIQRRGSEMYEGSFGVAEATKLGLMSKDNYQKQPAVMFKWRAIAEALRFTFPDAISGLYTPDEMGANVTVTDIGEMHVAEEKAAVSFPKETKREEEEVVDINTGEVIGFGEPAPAEPEEPVEEPKISEKQQRFLFVQLRQRGIPTEVFKQYLKSVHLIESSKEIPSRNFDVVLKWVKTVEI